MGLVFCTFKSIISIDPESKLIFKKSKMFGMLMSNEKVIIPLHCKGVIIKGLVKKGTGYYDLVLPVNYKIKSYDMFFQTEYHIVRIINTDLDRAKKIAEFLKANLNYDYIIE